MIILVVFLLSFYFRVHPFQLFQLFGHTISANEPDLIVEMRMAQKIFKVLLKTGFLLKLNLAQLPLTYSV